MSETKPKPPRRPNAVVESVTRERCLIEALEHGAKPWALDSEDGHIRKAVNALADEAERRMLVMTSNPHNRMRPLAAVQALIQAAWLAGWHAGRHYETGMAKAKREASAARREATKRATAVRRGQRARESAERA
jgi:ribosomal protein S21